MKVRFVIKEQEDTLVQPPEEVTSGKNELKNQIDSELLNLNLDDVDTQQLENLLNQIKTMKGEDAASLAEKKKLTKSKIKKRDEIADAISTKDIKKRYGVGKKKAKDIKYAIATKTAMK
jgi:hypothetical protein